MQAIRRVLSRPFAGGTVLALCVFAAWQTLNHLYLMRLPMLTYHLVSLVAETVGAAVVAFFVLRALLDKNRRLEELDRQKDMLASSIVHDLRQPLAALTMGLEIAERDPAITDRTRAIMAALQRGSAELVDMVNDLLDVSKLEAGQPLIETEHVPPAAFINDGVRGLRQLAQERDIDLTVSLPSELPRVRADSQRLRRVVMNLVGNALKFTPRGGRIDVASRPDPVRDRLLVSVSDTGVGIPKELHKAVFDKFAVLDARRSPGDRTSTGLGLTFAKMIVEAHGGEIWVESRPEQGTTFTFSLPIAGAPE